ncbi:hypothetical protein QBA35_08810 [Streptomyces bottropensis]|uniref:Uncharacterized protein n=1 Tax=Streptomyces bottropensis TaxID=42235 RepID=A0ABU8AIG3_9ACTN
MAARLNRWSDRTVRTSSYVVTRKAWSPLGIRTLDTGQVSRRSLYTGQACIADGRSKG